MRLEDYKRICPACGYEHRYLGTTPCQWCGLRTDEIWCDVHHNYTAADFRCVHCESETKG